MWMMVKRRHEGERERSDTGGNDDDEDAYIFKCVRTCVRKDVCVCVSRDRLSSAAFCILI